MSDEICPKCGLPVMICTCESILKGEQRIQVFTEMRRWGRPVTIIRGIDSKDLNLKDLTRKLKEQLACGGTYKDNTIELQGDQRVRIKDMLVDLGFPEENISVQKGRTEK
ncbi:MAG: translation initiation factor [Candidatus Hodarchaeota archaeon]